MKTLDEVITIMDGIDQTCTCCAYQHDCDETECIEKTALHYLKECCTLQTAYITAMADAEDNPPLTWDELKAMEGKPVWVEVDGKWWGRFWAFVEVGNDSYINFFQKGQEYPEDLWKSNMGKTWQAYRKERE